MTTISSTSSSTGTTTPASTTGTTTGSTASTTASTSGSGTATTTATGSATEALLTELGVSGNIDASSLADELSEAQYSSQVDQLNSQNSALSTEISDSSTLMNMVSTLASSLSTTITDGELSSTPQIANSAVATVSAGTTAGNGGTTTLEVDALAQGQTVASPTIPASTTDVGSGSLTITFGTISGSTFTAGSASPTTIAIAAGSSLSDVATDINNAGVGVTAYVASNSSGQQLVITGPQGAANAFTISASEDASDPGLAQFAYDPATSSASSGGATLAQSAGDASYILDGVARTSSTNSITDAAPGISLNLTGTNVGNPTSISFSDPTQAITSGMNDLVTALNSIVTQLNTDIAAGGPLADNPGAQALQQALSGLSSTVVMPDAGTGQPATLGDLGLTTNKDGTFTLDTTILGNALQSNPAAVAAMFTTGANGVYATIDNLSLNASNSADGDSLAGQVSDMQSQQSTIASQLSTIATEQSTLRTQLLTQYAALDSVVTADKSTQSFLTQQVSLWTNPTTTS